MYATRYFPSYTLGAMMAAQLFETAEKAIPDLRNKIAKGTVSSHDILTFN